MGLFDINDDRLQAMYNKAWVDEGHGFVDPRNHPELDHELMAYATYNNCSYDEALTLAMTGKRTGRLADK